MLIAPSSSLCQSNRTLRGLLLAIFMIFSSKDEHEVFWWLLIMSSWTCHQTHSKTAMASGWDEFAASAQLALERQQIVGQSLKATHRFKSPEMLQMTRGGEQDGKTLKRFLNRILGMSCRLQELLFFLVSICVILYVFVF